jgi:hypothetical protein
MLSSDWGGLSAGVAGLQRRVESYQSFKGALSHCQKPENTCCRCSLEPIVRRKKPIANQPIERA